MALQFGIGPRPWPAPAIHDTVAAIMHARAYQRSLRTSLLERLFRWLGEVIDRIGRALAEIPYGRYVAVGLTLLVAALVVLRVLYAARLRDEAARAARSRPRTRGTATAPWEEAQRLAGEGRYTEAAQALYRALLQTLVLRERVRLHQSKTSGDYARELHSRGSALYAPFRQFGRRYDRVLFGSGACDAGAYEQLLRDARPILEPECVA